ncbi:MAG: hypothetical protein HWD92_03435 [Flavobacteriia bacterium]|nr:hypothetical protein [Flavobacteriia bacterium]
MKRIISLFTLALCVSNLYGQSLTDDPLARQNLSESELSFYQDFLNFFNNQIRCEDFTTSEACWTEFLDGIQTGYGEGLDFIPYEDVKAFLSSSDTSGFKVWHKSPYVRFGQSDTSYNYSIAQNSPFFSLLMQAAEEDEYWQKVMESYENAGSFVFGIRNCLQKPLCNERLADPKMQTLLALYFAGFRMRIHEQVAY